MFQSLSNFTRLHNRTLLISNFATCCLLNVHISTFFALDLLLLACASVTFGTEESAAVQLNDCFEGIEADEPWMKCRRQPFVLI